MSAIRRMGVIAEHGSLAAYRAYLIEGRDETSRRLVMSSMAVMAEDEFPAYHADLRYQIMDWDVDIAWVDAELALDAVAA